MTKRSQPHELPLPGPVVALPYGYENTEQLRQAGLRKEKYGKVVALAAPLATLAALRFNRSKSGVGGIVAAGGILTLAAIDTIVSGSTDQEVADMLEQRETEGVEILSNM